MEKRWCERVPVEITVDVLRHGNKVGKCKVRDISLCGIRLVSGPLAFYDNTELMLKFDGVSNVTGNTDFINAVVVRSSSHEVGLVFNPVEPEMIQPIIKLSKNDNQSLAANTIALCRA